MIVKKWNKIKKVQIKPYAIIHMLKVESQHSTILKVNSEMKILPKVIFFFFSIVLCERIAIERVAGL